MRHTGTDVSMRQHQVQGAAYEVQLLFQVQSHIGDFVRAFPAVMKVQPASTLRVQADRVTSLTKLARCNRIGRMSAHGVYLMVMDGGAFANNLGTLGSIRSISPSQLQSVPYLGTGCSREVGSSLCIFSFVRPFQQDFTPSKHPPLSAQYPHLPRHRR